MSHFLTALPVNRRAVQGRGWPVAQASPANQTVGASAVKSAWPAADTNPFTGQLVRWIEGTGDNQDLPFAVVDQLAARIHVFSVQAQWRGTACWVRRATTNRCLE